MRAVVRLAHNILRPAVTMRTRSWSGRSRREISSWQNSCTPPSRLWGSNECS